MLWEFSESESWSVHEDEVTGEPVANKKKSAGKLAASSISENSKEQDIAQILSRSTIADRSWSATSRMSNIECTCTNQDTQQSDMEEFDTLASGERFFSQLPRKKEVTTETNPQSYRPIKGRQQHRKDQRRR